MQEKTADFTQVLSYLTTNKCQQAIALMASWSFERLVLFLVRNSKLLPTLRQPEFADFWAAKRDLLRLADNPAFRFVRQPGMEDADFVTGYLAFLLELKSEPNSSFVHKPLDDLSFHMVRKRLSQASIALGSTQELDDVHKFAALLYNKEGFAKQFGCPGYLLLFNGYLHLSQNFLRLEKKELAEEAVKNCWKWLHLAELTEQESQASINNCYFGEGLKLSNPFKLEKSADIKEFLLQQSGTLLP
ncbi:MAG: DUF5630 domain-containing protein, partial [Legionella sp.]